MDNDGKKRCPKRKQIDDDDYDRTFSHKMVDNDDKRWDTSATDPLFLYPSYQVLGAVLLSHVDAGDVGAENHRSLPCLGACMHECRYTPYAGAVVADNIYANFHFRNERSYKHRPKTSFLVGFEHSK